jgi:hypothetical protein
MTSSWREAYRSPVLAYRSTVPTADWPSRSGRHAHADIADPAGVDEARRPRSAPPALHAVNAVNAMNALNAVNAMNAVNAVNAVRTPGQLDRGGRMSPPLRILQVGECLLAQVSRAEVGRAAAVARQLPAEAGRLTVVVAGPLQSLVPELAERLQSWVWAGWRSVRLVGARAAAPDGGLSPAQMLADELGVEVVAPDGEMLAVPDGSLFVVADPGATRRGAWWRCWPGRAPVPVGARFPTPEWERDLAEFTDPDIPDVVVDEVPAGLWIHRQGLVKQTDLAFSVAADPQAVKLLVSRPGDEPLRAAQLQRLVVSLPDGLHQRMVVLPYGDQPVADGRLGAVMAAATERRVRVGTGLALRLAHGGSQVVAVDQNGAPAWRPFVRELAWYPRFRTPRALKWSNPLGSMVQTGPGEYALNRHWVVELVECGLWIRPVEGFGGEKLVRELPLDGQQCTVVVSGSERRWLGPPWRAVARLLRRLPADARSRLRLAVPEETGEAVAISAARACAGELAGRPVHVLEEDGTMVPRYVALRANRLQALVGWHGPVLRIMEQHPDTFSLVDRRAVSRANGHSRTAERDDASPVALVDDLGRRPLWPEVREGQSRDEVREGRSLDQVRERRSLDQVQREPSLDAHEGRALDQVRHGPVLEEVREGPSWDQVRRAKDWDQVRYGPDWHESHRQTTPMVAGATVKPRAGRHRAEESRETADPDNGWTSAPLDP